MKIASAAILVSVLITATVCPADWPHWRGPTYTGAAEAEGLPVSFGVTRNLLWSADMPGPAAATPIVHGGRVFLTSMGEDNALLAMAFDAATGGKLWSRQLGQAKPHDRRSTVANPSPVTDGKVVVFFFASGHMAAFDPTGEPVWERNIAADYGEFAFLWTFSASPTLHDAKLYLPVLQRNSPVQGRKGAESFLLILNPATGKTVARVVRPTQAIGESMEAYTTIVPVTAKGTTRMLVLGGDALTAHDPQTGRETWRWETYNPERQNGRRIAPTPVLCGPNIIICAPRGAPVYAIAPGAKRPTWVSEGNVSSDVATPLVYRDRLYVLNGDKRLLIAVDPRTGQAQWETKLKGAILRASPTGADGRIYCISHEADVFVVDSKSGELLATSRLADGSGYARSTIVVAGNRLYVRTDAKLYCFGTAAQ